MTFRPKTLLRLVGIVAVAAMMQNCAHANHPTLPNAPTIAPPRSGPCPVGAVLIPGGRATLGVNAVLHMPRAEYDVGAFCMDVHAITYLEYSECIKSGRCVREPNVRKDSPCEDDLGRPWRPWNSDEEDVHGPVMCLTYADVASYCALRSGRIPTEVEWEFAGRGTDARPFPWGSRPARWWNKEWLHDPDVSPYGVQGMTFGPGEWTSSKVEPEDRDPAQVTGRGLDANDTWFWSRGDLLTPSDDAWMRVPEAIHARARVGGRCVYAQRSAN